MNRKGIAGLILACCLLTACGQETEWQDVSVAPEASAAKDAVGTAENGAEDTAAQDAGGASENGGRDGSAAGNEGKAADGSAAGAAGNDGPAASAGNGGKLIENQTFQLNLTPYGQVTFVSCEPDTDLDPMADAAFSVQRDGQVLYTLPGVFADNVRANEIFYEVEAVSFPDINQDGYDDIIIICSYEPASGPDRGTVHQEARIYMGSTDGSFTLEKDLMDETNSALAVITIESVKGFLGIGRADAGAQTWQQAYIGLIQNDQVLGGYEGYDLIYLDDDEIPELVEIGNSAAAGCRLISYFDGELDVTQLNRLNFSYLEREGLLCNSDGNMDNYYDLVYRLADGKLTLIAQGYYGAEDNSRVQFDESGEPIYRYDWNGTEMSSGEYEKELNAVFDTKRAKEYAWPGISAEEMIGKIEALAP